jgi:hypothetical protein
VSRSGTPRSRPAPTTPAPLSSACVGRRAREQQAAPRLGVVTDGDHDPFDLARRDRGPLVEHRAPLRDGGGDDGLLALGHRERFAGEARLVDLGVRTREDATVGRHEVARVQAHDVALHEHRSADRDLVAVAAHGDRPAAHVRQARDRALGPEALDAAHHRVRAHHGSHHDSVGERPDHRRQRRPRREHRRQGARQLGPD